jgi:hypothetical protein
MDTDKDSSLLATPPAKNYNGDKSIFYNTLEMSPNLKDTQAVLHVGNYRDELSIAMQNRTEYLNTLPDSQDSQPSSLFTQRCAFVYHP